MKKNLQKIAFNTLIKLSVLIAKTTVCSTTRFNMYQPEADYKVYQHMKDKKII